MSVTRPRRLGSTDLYLGPLGCGGAPLGELYEKISETLSQQTLEQAYRSGVRLFDTAPWYGHGLSEHRFGHCLRQRPRGEFIVSTKVGRVYSAPDHPDAFSTAPWAGGLPFQLRFDYSYDGVTRSYQDSLLRLGLNRVDALVVHDLDFGYHKTAAAVAARLEQLEHGGWRALQQLKRSGRIGAVGVGINELSMMGRFLDRFDVDFFLVAMPYTLLDQTPLAELFPRCQRAGVGVIVGAPYASGILATGAVAGAKYNYAAAEPAVIDRVRRIDAVCEAYRIPLAAAALQFPLGHPSVAAVIPGAASPQQAAANATLMEVDIPAAFWRRLKEDGLIAADAPTELIEAS